MCVSSSDVACTATAVCIGYGSTVMISSSTYSIFEGAKRRPDVTAFMLTPFIYYVKQFVPQFFWYASFTVDSRLPVIAKSGFFATSFMISAAWCFP
jgi:hypothetical protein